MFATSLREGTCERAAFVPKAFRNLNRRGLQPLVSVEKVCFSVGEAKSPMATDQFKSKI